MPETPRSEDTASADDESPQYAVRLTPRAIAERAEAAAWIAEWVDEETAREWVSRLREAIGTLTTQPRRYSVQESDSRNIGRETRRLLYQRTPGSAAYHLYYVVEDDGLDGPRVIVFHIRHASRRSLGRKEARELRQEL